MGYFDVAEEAGGGGVGLYSGVYTNPLWYTILVSFKCADFALVIRPTSIAKLIRQADIVGRLKLYCCPFFFFFFSTHYSQQRRRGRPSNVYATLGPRSR